MASLLTLDPYVTDWLNLLTRWLHVIAGIVWIGSSFYFIALDNHLRPPQDEREREAGIGGETWEIHGGGFYNIKKYLVAPRVLPETLHWFKWEAYTTWLSGFALMIVLYYLNADTYLIDKSVSDLSTGEAVAISIGLLVAAWLVYDVLCRLLAAKPFVLAAVLLGLITLAAWGIGHLFSGRAMYLQVGAMLGTMMVGNVFFVIIPAHWELVRAKQAGREPDPAANARGKLRSVHNNYLTLPVVFTMLAGHFPLAFGSDHAWLVLLAIFAIVAAIRHFFNRWHVGRRDWWILGAAAAGAVALAVVLAPEDVATVDLATDGEAATIVAQRCAVCHSGASAPLGIELLGLGQVKRYAREIKAQVSSGAMPPGNATGLTDAERAKLVAWAAAAG